MQEQQAAKNIIAQQAAANAAKRPRTPGRPSSTPTLLIADPVKLNLVKQESDIIVQDGQPLTDPQVSDESEPSASDGDTDVQGSRDSNLATDEDADTSDMCDDSDDGPRRKRGRAARAVRVVVHLLSPAVSCWFFLSGCREGPWWVNVGQKHHPYTTLILAHTKNLYAYPLCHSTP